MGWGDGKKIETNGVHPAGRYAPDVTPGMASCGSDCKAPEAAPDAAPPAEPVATAAEVERVVEARDAYRQGYLDLQDRLAAARRELAEMREQRDFYRRLYTEVTGEIGAKLTPLVKGELDAHAGQATVGAAAALIGRLKSDLDFARDFGARKAKELEESRGALRDLARTKLHGDASPAPGENPATAALRRLARSLADQIGPGTEAAADVSGADVAVVTGEDALGNAGFRVSVSCDSDAASLTLANAVEDLLDQVQVYLQKDGLDQMADEIAAAKRAESARGDDKADADAPPGTPANPLRMAVGDTLHIISNGLTYRFTFREP